MSRGRRGPAGTGRTCECCQWGRRRRRGGRRGGRSWRRAGCGRRTGRRCGRRSRARALRGSGVSRGRNGAQWGAAAWRGRVAADVRRQVSQSMQLVSTYTSPGAFCGRRSRADAAGAERTGGAGRCALRRRGSGAAKAGGIAWRGRGRAQAGGARYGETDMSCGLPRFTHLIYG